MGVVYFELVVGLHRIKIYISGGSEYDPVSACNSDVPVIHQMPITSLVTGNLKNIKTELRSNDIL